MVPTSNFLLKISVKEKSFDSYKNDLDALLFEDEKLVATFGLSYGEQSLDSAAKTLNYVKAPTSLKMELDDDVDSTRLFTIESLRERMSTGISYNFLHSKEIKMQLK